MHLSLDQLAFLETAGGRDALAQAATLDATRPADVAALRKCFHADQAAAAFEVVAARRKGRLKFGDLADELIADVEAVEQASSLRVARHKARRFAERAAGRPAWDLCCGLGGDARALAELMGNASVTAVDRDAGRAWMAQRFAGCASLCDDVATLALPADAAWHIDPSRRSERGRAWRLDDYAPPPEVWFRLLATHPDACLKLSPGLDVFDFEDRWAANAPAGLAVELQFVSEAGRLVQTLAWTGGLASGHARSAALLVGDAAHELAGEPRLPDAAFDPVDHDQAEPPPAKYLYTVDPAVERGELVAQLADELDAAALHPRLGLLMSDELIESPFVTAFEWLDVLPFHRGNPRPRKLKQLKEQLAVHGAGVVEVKTRDQVVDPDVLQKQLTPGSTPGSPPGSAKGAGSKLPGGAGILTLFVYRFDRTVRALVARRLGRSAGR